MSNIPVCKIENIPSGSKILQARELNVAYTLILVVVVMSFYV